MKRLLFLAVLSLLFFATHTEPLNAQSTWHYECDFTVTDGGWETVRFDNGNPYSEYVAETGWRALYTNNNAWPQYTSLTGTFTITSMGLIQYGDYFPTMGVWYDVNLTNPFTGGSSGSGSGSGGGYVTYNNNSLSWSSPARISASGRASGGKAVVTFVSINGTGENPFGKENCVEEDEPDYSWIKPVGEDEADGLYDMRLVAQLGQRLTSAGFRYFTYPVLWTGNEYSVSAWSAAAGAKVHAPAESTVVGLERLTWDDCGIGSFQFDYLEDEVTYRQYVPEAPAPCWVGVLNTEIDPEGELPSDEEVWPEKYYLDPTDTWKVTLSITEEDEAEFEAIYIVRNADMYLIAGDTLSAGCVLGESIPLTTVPVNDPGFLGLSAISGIVGIVPGPIGLIANLIGGAIDLLEWIFPAQLEQSTGRGYVPVTVFDAEGDVAPALNYFDTEPTNNSPCNQTEEYAACVNSPGARFENYGDGWDVTGGNPTWLNPGALLPMNTSISQTLNLDDTMPYTVLIRAQAIGGIGGELRVWLGQHTERVDVIPEWDTIKVTVDPLVPDGGLLSTVGLQNTGDVEIEVLSICVAEGDVDAGNGCYFAGVEDWTPNAGATYLDDGNLSMWLMGNDGTISHDVSLEPGEYTLTVNGLWWFDGLLDWDAEAAISYQFPAAEDFVALEPELTGMGMMGPFETSATITVTEAVTDTMTLKVNLTAEANILGLKITRICLSANAPPGTGEDPPFRATCTYMPRPTGAAADDVGQWIYWHWSNLDRFFTCDLMVLLNRMYATMRDGLKLAGWSIKWNQSYLMMMNTWSERQLFPWLDGHFRNMAVGQVTTIESGGANIWDVLLALVTGVFAPLIGILQQLAALIIGLITQIADLLLTVVVSVISLVLAIVGQGVNLLITGQQMLSSIITAYNTASPTSIPGLPDCVDPKSHWLCTGVWIADNTIFSGPGAALIPLVIAILSIHLVLWVIGTIKQALAGLGQSA